MAEIMGVLDNETAANVAEAFSEELVKYGCSQPLVVPYLSKCAQIRAKELAELQSAVRPDGNWWYEVIDWTKITWGGAGECRLVVEVTGEEENKQILAELMQQLKNKVSISAFSNYSDIGCGAFVSSDSMMYVSLIVLYNMYGDDYLEYNAEGYEGAYTATLHPSTVTIRSGFTHILGNSYVPAVTCQVMGYASRNVSTSSENDCNTSTFDTVTLAENQYSSANYISALTTTSTYSRIFFYGAIISTENFYQGQYTFTQSSTPVGFAHYSVNSSSVEIDIPYLAGGEYTVDIPVIPLELNIECRSKVDNSYITGVKLKLTMKGGLYTRSEYFCPSPTDSTTQFSVVTVDGKSVFTFYSYSGAQNLFCTIADTYEIEVVDGVPEEYETPSTATFTLTTSNVISGTDSNTYVVYFSKKKTINHSYKYIKPNEICVYSYETNQSGFNDNHGLAVLNPTECTITEELNGSYYLDIKHPIDEYGKADCIRENNIIKAMGQLFTIKNVKHSYKGDSGTVTARAEHIFYQLGDWWIFPQYEDDDPPIVYTKGDPVQTFLDNWCEFFVNKMLVDGQTYYTFSWYSNMYIPDNYNEVTTSNENGTSPINLIMESGGVLDVVGGELYRDNFYFSICEKMEHMNENAFEIRVGKNLKGIDRVIDISTMCTYYQGYDNYGNLVGVSWHNDSFLAIGVPHSVIRSKSYSYSFNDESMTDSQKAEEAMKLLSNDVLLYFEEYCKPLLSYTVDIDDIENNYDFKELSNKPEYKVGNSGIVYDERLGQSTTLRITKTVTDAITGKTKTVVFGDKRKFKNEI